MENKIIQQILQAAVQAPSGDNVQPWKIEVSENLTQLKLINLPEKDNSIYNYEQMASYIAHGAAIENIVIASGQLGYKADLELFPDDNNPNVVAKISLLHGVKNEEPLFPAIFERHTNRFFYKKVKISEDTKQSLTAEIEKIRGASLLLVDQPSKIDQLAKCLMVNDRLVFENKQIHQFLFNMIRWSKQQVEDTLDGMPVDVMGVNVMEKMVFPFFRYWSFVKFNNYLGLSRFIGLKSWWNMKNSPLIGVVSVEGKDKVAFVQGGRAAQRCWLQITKEGLAFQPIIGLPLLINRLRFNNLDLLSHDQQRHVERAATTLIQTLNLSSDANTMIMGFRAGLCAKPKVRTKRKSVDSFISGNIHTQ